MMVKNKLKSRLRKTIFGLFFAILGAFGAFSGALVAQNSVYAVESDESSVVTQSGTDDCQASLGALGWLVCPTTGKISEAVDLLYDKIEDILVINPVMAEDGEPIFEVWKYLRGISNIVFIIFLLVVIYSQITGIGISNYGLKKALPKLIIAAILVNLSFSICSLAVDVSNILGNGLRGVFTSIEETVVANSMGGEMVTAEMKVSQSEMFSAMAGGTALAIGGAVIAFETGAIWMLIPLALGAIVAVVSGLITISLRQAVVAILIMISPLAIVAYMLPNTDDLFKKWRKLLVQMLVFYPMFSLLFGASSLAGFAIIASAKDGFWLLVGTAVQIFPLFFSWSLMKMSGTFLGEINTRIRGLATGPLASNRAWADSRREQARAYNMQHGRTPYSWLQRNLDNKKALRTYTTVASQQLRSKEAEDYVDAKIMNGYDGSKAKATDGKFKPNKYTRLAKDLANAELRRARMNMDREHVISNYGSYYVKPELRDGEQYDKYRRNVSKEDLRAARASNPEYRRNEVGAKEYLELYRAQMTQEHDAEADIDFATSVFLKTVPADATKEDWDNYNHYVLSAAGGLGNNKADRVRGKIIARAAGVEAAQRRDIGYLGAKWAVPKYSLRNMVVGYHHDSDGYAIDQSGERIESERGYLLNHDPSKLWWWENVDPVYGPYFNWTNEKGEFISRVYKSNSAAVKELLTNFDIPINDPVNNLYTILTGVNPDPNAEDKNMRFVGLGKFKTTLSRSLINFKEKNAAFGPMVAEMAKKGLIKNATDLNIAYIDSVNKTVKTGNFNVQDSDAIRMMERIINKGEWSNVFREDEIREYHNIDDDSLKGLTADGRDVPTDKATIEELMNRLEKKFVAPAAVKMVAMMARITPNTLDNQKISTLKEWAKLIDTAEKYWTSEIDSEGYLGELKKVKRRFEERISEKQGNVGNSSQNTDEDSVLLNEFNDINKRLTMQRKNHLIVLDEILADSLDGFTFIQKVDDYCNEQGLSDVAREFHRQTDETMLPDELYGIAVNIFGGLED